MSRAAYLYILGSSGFAREVAAYAREMNDKIQIIFVDNSVNDKDCISVNQYWNMIENEQCESIIGAGRSEIRERMMKELRPPFASIIHPRSVILGHISPGCVIAPGAVIAPNAKLSKHVAVNYNATIGHDVFVGDLSIVGPGSSIGGWCSIGESVYIGAGALIREKLHIGSGAIIGMGAVVTKDVPENLVAIGMPARFFPRENCGNGWLS
jgi:sugar O-acyltransferase (sialic acid O-acetyltransferase NeuD family)